MSASKVAPGARLPKFSVLGTYGAKAIVRHVGLAVDDSIARAGEETEVYDCQPPLRIGATSHEIGSMLADVMGDLNLTDKERSDIEVWLARERTRMNGDRRNKRLRYTVLPATRFRAGENEQVIHRDFSCAGFVAAAYSEGANLTLVDDTALPMIAADALAEVYGAQYLEFARRQDFGLSGDGPWPVLLPGYLLHALGQANIRNKPHTPTAADATFP